jgi:hypothetical protein
MERNGAEWSGTDMREVSMREKEGKERGRASTRNSWLSIPIKPLAERNVEGGTEDNGTESERVLTCARLGV